MSADGRTSTKKAAVLMLPTLGSSVAAGAAKSSVTLQDAGRGIGDMARHLPLHAWNGISWWRQVGHRRRLQYQAGTFIESLQQQKASPRN
jgi:hypothetical protein